MRISRAESNECGAKVCLLSQAQYLTSQCSTGSKAGKVPDGAAKSSREMRKGERTIPASERIEECHFYCQLCLSTLQCSLAQWHIPAVPALPSPRQELQLSEQPGLPPLLLIRISAVSLLPPPLLCSTALTLAYAMPLAEPAHIFLTSSKAVLGQKLVETWQI